MAMVTKKKLVEEPADPLVDYYDPLSPQQLIEALKFSRHMLDVVEGDRRVFEDDLRDWRETTQKEQTGLERRRDLVFNLLQEVGDPPKGIEPTKRYVSDIWIQYGRKVPDSLVFRGLSINRIKEVLRRRIVYHRRRLDRMTSGRVYLVRKQGQIRTKARDIVIFQHEKEDPGSNHYLTGLHNNWLQLVLRQTRDVVQSLGGHMTFFDHLQDSAAKFGRVKEYLSEDAWHFTRLLEDLQDQVRMQYKELLYLMTVFREVSWSAVKAKKLYYEGVFEMRDTEAIRRAMLEEIEQALHHHREVCKNCMQRLLAVNDSILHGKSAAIGLAGENRNCVKPYPHAINSAPKHHSKEDDELSLKQTELSRAYEVIKEHTLASTPEDLLSVVRTQVGRALELQSSIDRLQYLQQTVLQPESLMFARERERCRMQLTARRKAIEKAYSEIQGDYEKKTTKFREVIKEQRDNVDDFMTFHDVLHSLCTRMGKNFGTYEEDMRLLEDSGGMEGLLDVVEVNLQRITDGPLRRFYDQQWPLLQQVVDDSEFLEMRARKMPAINNRVEYDSVTVPPRADEPPAGSSRPNPRFITHSQIMEANWMIQERARLAELQRLREAAAEDEREKQRAEKIEKAKDRKVIKH